ncbi:MAG: CHAT domain-containing protein [Rubrivivax sp.]|nr:CHAT domain-containing protein [Pyrinomonadaceae bacterium]
MAQADELNRQVMKLYGEGRYAEAIPLAERALALKEKAFGPDHLSVAHALSNLATLYEAQVDYVRAEPLRRRALAVYEKALGTWHPDVALSLNNLAALHGAQGDYARAEPLYKRSLAIRERVRGPDHPDVALSLNNLASLYISKGDYMHAEPLLQRSFVIDEKVLGPEHPDLAADLNNLAELYRLKGDYARAEPLYRRSLAISEKALGTEDPSVAISLNNLAELYLAQGDYARAELLLQRALVIDEKAFGPEHPDLATDLVSLASLYISKGEYIRAEPLLQRALAVYEKVLGPEHPFVALTLNRLATLYISKGDHVGAVQYQAWGNEVRERNLALVLATGSERQKLAYLQTLAGETYATVSLHARSAPQDRQALKLALTTILRRKGRALDAMSDQISSLRRRLDPQERALLDQLSAAQWQLSTLVLGGPGKTRAAEHVAAIARQEAEVERLQDQVSRRSAEFRVQAQPVTIEKVRQALPPTAALVEFTAYRPYNQKAQAQSHQYGPAHYAAYVLRSSGEPLWVELGEAAAIDADVGRLRAALRCPGEVRAAEPCPALAAVKKLARALDERVMRPVRKLLGDTHRIFLAPDGQLNLIPFAALVDEKDKYLVESYSLTYLTSGRDLLRLQLNAKSRQPPLVVANPLFAPDQASRVSVERAGRRSADLSQMYFEPLRSTAQEAQAISQVLSEARVLTQTQATEAAIKQIAGPRVLHVATHGFFLSDQPHASVEGARGLILGSSAASPARVENPLLRSGLALEGANLRQSTGGEDGILTALEVSGLDLWGTNLVVLSACETGLGEVQNGEGVYGLRRALLLAGSESQVMSLWKVSDDATKDLMVGYYRRLQAGEGRTEALRQVQLEMLIATGPAQAGGRRGIGDELGAAKTADRTHPYYWAAFIQSGDWRGMHAQPSVIR